MQMSVITKDVRLTLLTTRLAKRFCILVIAVCILLVLTLPGDTYSAPRCVTPEEIETRNGKIRATTILCGGVYRPLQIKSSDVLLDCLDSCLIVAYDGVGVHVDSVDRAYISNLTIQTWTPRSQATESLGAHGIANWCGYFKGVGVSLINSTDSTVDDIKIAALLDGEPAGVVGVDICGGGDNEVKNSDLSNTSGWGIRAVATDHNRFYRNTARNNLRADGSANESANILIVGNWDEGKGSNGNVVYQNTLLHGGDGVYINGYDYPTSNFNLVRENVIADSLANCIEGTGNPTPGTSGTNVFVNNTLSNCGEHFGWITFTVETVFCGNGEGPVDAKKNFGTLVDLSRECPHGDLILTKGLPWFAPALKNSKSAYRAPRNSRD